MTTARSLKQQPYGHIPRFIAGDMASEAGWPVALRALLLLSEAGAATDPLLARLTDDELALLRASLVRLSGIEPTSAA